MSKAQQIMAKVGAQEQRSKEQRQETALKTAEVLYKRFYDLSPRRTLGFFRINWSYLKATVTIHDVEIPLEVNGELLLFWKFCAVNSKRKVGTRSVSDALGPL